MTLSCNAPYGSTPIAWRVKADEEITPCKDYKEYISAPAFVRFPHHHLNAAIGGAKGKEMCHYINGEIQLSEERDEEIFNKQPNEIKIWNAIQTLIPSFGEYKKIEISTDFIDAVFRPIIPDSPLIDLAHHQWIALRVCALVLLLIEAPIRHFGVFIICRAMDLYSFYNADFAEYYRFRAKINSNHPLSEITKNILEIGVSK